MTITNDDQLAYIIKNKLKSPKTDTKANELG